MKAKTILINGIIKGSTLLIGSVDSTKDLQINKYYMIFENMKDDDFTIFIPPSWPQYNRYLLIRMREYGWKPLDLLIPFHEVPILSHIHLHAEKDLLTQPRKKWNLQKLKSKLYYIKKILKGN